MDRERRKQKAFQVESSVYKGVEAGLEGHFRTANDPVWLEQGRFSSSVRFEAGKVGEDLALE